MSLSYGVRKLHTLDLLWIDGHAVLNCAVALTSVSFISLACALCSAWWARGEAAIDSTSRISQLAPLRIERPHLLSWLSTFLL